VVDVQRAEKAEPPPLDVERPVPIEEARAALGSDLLPEAEVAVELLVRQCGPPNAASSHASRGRTA
jgi:hypothetical protein